MQSVKIYFELNKLLDCLYKSRAQVLFWMFHPLEHQNQNSQQDSGSRKLSHPLVGEWHIGKNIPDLILTKLDLFFHHTLIGWYHLCWSQTSRILSLDLFPSVHSSASDQQTPAFNRIWSQKNIFEPGKPRMIATENLRAILKGRRVSLATFHW